MNDDSWVLRDNDWGVPAYIGLGSNLGNPQQQLKQALHALAHLEKSRLIRCSHFYKNKAIGPGVQPDYLNAVALIATTLSPLDLLTHLQHIEYAQGRVRLYHWGPRTLDLDILLYGNITMHSSNLIIPHPHMLKRPFVMRPLLDIFQTDPQFTL